MLVERREALSHRRVKPSTDSKPCWRNSFGTAKDITTGQAKRMLASVRPRDIAGKTRRRIAAEEAAELVAVEAKMTKATAEAQGAGPDAGLALDGPARRRTVVAGQVRPTLVTSPGSLTATGSPPGPAPHPRTPPPVARTAPVVEPGTGG